jgi:hypothetical protein
LAIFFPQLILIKYSKKQFLMQHPQSCGVEVDRAYDPDKAIAQTKCWLNEVVNGVEHDLSGQQEFGCLHGAANDNYLATYATKLGPSMGYCGTDHFGLVQPCSADKPWLRAPQTEHCERHFQLETAMGMNLPKMVQPQPSLAHTTCNNLPAILKGKRERTSASASSMMLLVFVAVAAVIATLALAVV